MILGRPRVVVDDDDDDNVNDVTTVSGAEAQKKKQTDVVILPESVKSNNSSHVIISSNPLTINKPSGSLDQTKSSGPSNTTRPFNSPSADTSAGSSVTVQASASSNTTGNSTSSAKDKPPSSLKSPYSSQTPSKSNNNSTSNVTKPPPADTTSQSQPTTKVGQQWRRIADLFVRSKSSFRASLSYSSSSQKESTESSNESSNTEEKTDTNSNATTSQKNTSTNSNAVTSRKNTSIGPNVVASQKNTNTVSNATSQKKTNTVSNVTTSQKNTNAVSNAVASQKNTNAVSDPATIISTISDTDSGNEQSTDEELTILNVVVNKPRKRRQPREKVYSHRSRRDTKNSRRTYQLEGIINGNDSDIGFTEIDNDDDDDREYTDSDNSRDSDGIENFLKNSTVHKRSAVAVRKSRKRKNSISVLISQMPPNHISLDAVNNTPIPRSITHTASQNKSAMPLVARRTRGNTSSILMRNGKPIPIFIQFKASNRTQLAQEVLSMSGRELISAPTAESWNFTDPSLVSHVSETLRWNEFKFHDVKFLEDCRRYGCLLNLDDYLIYDPATTRILPKPIEQINAGAVDSEEEDQKGAIKFGIYSQASGTQGHNLQLSNTQSQNDTLATEHGAVSSSVGAAAFVGTLPTESYTQSGSQDKPSESSLSSSTKSHTTSKFGFFSRLPSREIDYWNSTTNVFKSSKTTGPFVIEESDEEEESGEKQGKNGENGMKHGDEIPKKGDNQTKQAPSEEVVKKTLSEEVMNQTASEVIAKKTPSEEVTNQASSEEVTNQADDQRNGTNTLPQPVIDKISSTNNTSSTESLSLSNSSHLDYSFLKLSPSSDNPSLQQVPQEQAHLNTSPLDSTPALGDPPSSPSRFLYDNSHVSTSLPKPIYMDVFSGLNQNPISTSPSSSSKISSLNETSSMSSPLFLNNSSLSNEPVPAQNSVPIAVASTTPPRLESIPTPTSTCNTGKNKTHSAQIQADSLNEQHYKLVRDVGLFYCMHEAYLRRVPHADCFRNFCEYYFSTKKSSFEIKRDWAFLQEDQEKLCKVYNNILVAKRNGTMSNSQREILTALDKLQRDMDKWDFCDECQVKPYLVQGENEVTSSLPLPESAVGPSQPSTVNAPRPYIPIINCAPRPYLASVGRWFLPSFAQGLKQATNNQIPASTPPTANPLAMYPQHQNGFNSSTLKTVFGFQSPTPAHIPSDPYFAHVLQLQSRQMMTVLTSTAAQEIITHVGNPTSTSHKVVSVVGSPAPTNFVPAGQSSAAPFTRPASRLAPFGRSHPVNIAFGFKQLREANE